MQIHLQISLNTLTEYLPEQLKTVTDQCS